MVGDHGCAYPDATRQAISALPLVAWRHIRTTTASLGVGHPGQARCTSWVVPWVVASSVGRAIGPAVVKPMARSHTGRPACTRTCVCWLLRLMFAGVLRFPFSLQLPPPSCVRQAMGVSNARSVGLSLEVALFSPSSPPALGFDMAPSLFGDLNVAPGPWCPAGSDLELCWGDVGAECVAPLTPPHRRRQPSLVGRLQSFGRRLSPQRGHRCW